MSLDADAIVDRRRLRRKLTFWRVLAALIVLLAAGGFVLLLVPGNRLLARRRLYRPHQGHRPDPQQPRPGRGARAAGQVARQGRDRAYRQPRRHHRRLAAALRRAACLAGQEADGGGGRRAGRLRRLYRGAGLRPHHRPRYLDRRLDRRAVPVSQLHRGAENARHQGRIRSNPARSRPRPSASSRPARRRAPPSRRSCSTPMPGSRTWCRPAARWTPPSWPRSTTAASSPAARASASSWSMRLGNEQTALAWLAREKHVPANTPVRDYSLEPRFGELSFLHAAALDLPGGGPFGHCAAHRRMGRGARGRRTQS